MISPPQRRKYHARSPKNSFEEEYGPSFLAQPQKVILLTIGYGNCRAVETVENELHVFHRSHRAWKTRPTTPEFPTVPTASNAGYCSGEKKKQRLREGLSKIEWTRCSQKRKNLSSRPLSIGRF
jgi:hypothetical protein